MPFLSEAKASEAELPQTLVNPPKKSPEQLGGGAPHPVPSNRNVRGFPHELPTAKTKEAVAPQTDASETLAPLTSSSDVFQPVPS
jgi:hypothetical protein